MRRAERRRWTRGILAVLCAVALPAWASALVPQTPLPGRDIPKFVTPLSTFGSGPSAAAPRVSGTDLVLRMMQTRQQVLPSGYPKTTVWAYRIEDPLGAVLGPAHWPAVTIEATRGTPTTVHLVNALPPGNPDVLDPADPDFSLQTLLTVDPTLDWANPLGLAESPQPYLGPPPAVVHLHGGEVPSAFDGGPLAWFTPDLAQKGPGFVSDTFVYPNRQEAGTLWFHDHAFGVTRLNVYGGLAGFYLLRDPPNTPANLPTGAYEVELAIQDRQFDTHGQLLFPDQGINPEHPFWVPEFLGDVIVVNGVSWPYFQVEARRYRLRILNGSSARFYDLKFGEARVWQIGADDNLFDAPVALSHLLIAPGERADLIVDFAPAAGRTFVVTNDAKAPFPGGTPADPQTTGQILQFRVGPALAPGTDSSCNPALNDPQRPTECVRPHPLVRLASGGFIAGGVHVDRVRQLTLNEVLGPGGPLELLLNNTSFDDPATEMPRVGSTELWEIVNLTADTHPIHLHLTQFQVLNRQRFQKNKYLDLYAAAFPGGVYVPGGGPPLPYEVGTVGFAGEQIPFSGGNPDVTPLLQGKPSLPDPEEQGWRDTVRMNAGEVTRILVRWAPTDAPTLATAPACPAQNPVPESARPCSPVPGSNLFPFDPTLGLGEGTDFSGAPGGPGYAWHCHILDHEDNEMMRAYVVAR